MRFLLVYRRSTGIVVLREVFRDDEAKALARRFELEAKEKDDPDVEIVLLTADSEEALRRTHSRYFKTTTELASAFGNTVDTAVTRSRTRQK